jgi:hypothetical protein
LAFGIGKGAVENAGEVLQMEADRGYASWLLPK